MRNNPYKPFLWKIALSLFTGFFMYLAFSKYQLLFFLPFALIFLFVIRDRLYWFFSGFFFFFLSLRCSSIAAVEFGGVNNLLFYFIFGLFAILLALYQFYIPFVLWKRFFSESLWALPPLYVFFEVLRSYFPYGGFPWLILGSISIYLPIVRDSMLYLNVYFQSLLWLFTTLFLVQRRFKLLILLWLPFILLGFLALWEKDRRLQEAQSIKVALVQTAVPQEDKLNREAFIKHAEDILNLVEKAISYGVDLVVLPESALPFFFSEDRDENLRLMHLSKESAILVGFIDIREGMKPYNSAYLFARGMMVDYYDKVKLFPIGEYLPAPFGFLKRLFPAIGGIDYLPGERIKPVEYQSMRIATPICFEVAYYSLVKRLSKEANLIAVLTNDGWFKDSDCTHQHYLWARVRALENGKYLLWVNNSGDTGIIDPFGRVLERMPYMKRGIIFDEIKLLP